MIKKLFLLSLICFFKLAISQQNQEFAEVKHYFDNQRSILLTEFKKKFDEEKDFRRKTYIRDVLTEFMSKLDSVQNAAFIGTLIRVKNREDLSAIQKQNYSENLPHLKNNSIQYPGGNKELYQQIIKNFYVDFIVSPVKPLKTELHFIIESDGSITGIKAFGDDPTFNRQAEIAGYLLPKRFFADTESKPPGGRYQYKLPLVIDFR